MLWKNSGLLLMKHSLPEMAPGNSFLCNTLIPPVYHLAHVASGIRAISKVLEARSLEASRNNDAFSLQGALYVSGVGYNFI